MKTLMGEISDISVDQIIERVLIRNGQLPYDYTHKQQQKLTPQEHIWHFQLQQENLELKGKVQKLKAMLKKKEDQLLKQANLQKQLSQLKQELESVLNHNNHLQNGINKLRLKNNQNSQINESLQDSLEDSLRNRKTVRQCSCSSQINLIRSSPHKKTQSKDKIVNLLQSPKKEILKLSKQVSIFCRIDNDGGAEQKKQKVLTKRLDIEFLQQLVRNQAKILEQYEREISSRPKKQLIEKKYTQASTERLYPLIRPTSVKNFLSPSAVGSIVKIKRN